jgi:hypothetical protein
MSLAIFSKVHSRNRPQLDAQGLQEDGEDVGHQHDEEKLESERSTGGNVSRIIAYDEYLVTVL